MDSPVIPDDPIEACARVGGQCPSKMLTGEKSVGLALQGGGAHGAFTWGVLDALLEDGRLIPEGVCGTSAGAMNAVMMAYGLQSGGRAGAREMLETYWRRVSAIAAYSPVQPSPLDRLVGGGRLDFSPGYHFAQTLSQFFSPYEMNPANVNVLEGLLEDLIDFSAFKRCETINVFVCATNVLTGRSRVFSTAEIGVRQVLASAALPSLYRAVEIDGEHYWDGGYMGNPPIYPLIYGTDTEDVMLVQINPVNISKVPTTAQEIRDRINELSFNSSLMSEMRTIAFVRRMVEEGKLSHERYKAIKVHTINAEEQMAPLGVSSKLNADWGFIREMFALGRDRMQSFLVEHYDTIGKDSTTDIRQTFL